MISWKLRIIILCAIVGLLFVVALLANIVGDRIGGTTSSVGEIRHPTPENIPMVTDPRRIARHGPVTGDGSYAFLETKSYSQLTIGVAEGSAHEMFGFIEDVVIDYGGHIFILDSQYNEVRVFDYDGSFISTIGAPGQGPGEFLAARNALISSQGNIVAVMSGPKVELFDRQGPTSFTYRSTFSREGYLGPGGCAMNDHLYLLAVIPNRDGMIHKHTFDGEMTQSFGAPYNSDNDQVVRHMSTRARLACGEKYDIVGFLMDFSPVLTGFREDGGVAWHVSFEGFLASAVWERRTPEGRNRISYSPNEVGEAFYTYMFFHQDYFYVGYDVRGDGTGHHFRIHAESGYAEYLGTLDAAIYGIDGERVIAASNFPFPTVKVFNKR